MCKKLLFLLLFFSIQVVGSQRSFSQVTFDEAVRYVETNSRNTHDGSKIIEGKEGNTRASMIVQNDKISIISTSHDLHGIIASFVDTPIAVFVAHLSNNTSMTICYKDALWQFSKTLDGDFVAEPVELNELKASISLQTTSIVESLGIKDDDQHDEWQDTVIAELTEAQQDAAASSAAQWNVTSLLAGIIFGGT